MLPVGYVAVLMIPPPLHGHLHLDFAFQNSYCVRLITISLLFLYDIMKKQTPIPFDDYFQYNCNNTRSHSRTLAALTQEHLFPPLLL